MTIGIWILGDQLSIDQSALSQKAPVILIESSQHVKQRPYHRQKLILVWSAMRHFAEELRQAGWDVTYEVAPDFEPALQHWVKTHQITELRVMQPNDRPFAQQIANLDLPCKITLLPNNLFLWTATEFSAWAIGR